MQRVMKLIVGALAVSAILGYRMHRGTPEMTRLALQESSSLGGAYVYFPRAQRIHVALKAWGTAGADIDAFAAIASPRQSNAVATCLEEALPWAAKADCAKPGWMRALVSWALRARLVTAVFPDGSARTYVFDGGTGGYLPVPGSARDGIGNGIPENVAMASNGGGLSTYVFQGADSDRDQAQMIRQLEGLGLGGSYTDGDNRLPITCVARASGTVCLHAL